MFWPVSRKSYPKQFCDLSNKPLQTLTIQHLQKFGSAVLVSSEELKNLTERDITQNKFEIEKVLYLPEAQNSAATIALICRYFELTNRGDTIIGIFPTDGFISNPDQLDQVLEISKHAAQDDLIVSLKDSPNTLNHEILVFKVARMIEQFKKLEPQTWAKISQINHDFTNLKQAFMETKNVSIDEAIIEKLPVKEIHRINREIGWDSLENWDELIQSTSQQSDDLKTHNVIPTAISSTNNFVFSKQRKNYGLVGCDDLIIVDTADATLVCKKGESHKIEELVQKISKSDSKMTTNHVFEDRPWGRFEILRDGDHFKSKIIRVDPGQKLSYQSHAKRSEHWVIISGVAHVILNDKENVVSQGEHIFIPQGSKHRLINKSDAVVEFIEVQVGSYFGEDDIVRYQDDYGRN